MCKMFTHAICCFLMFADVRSVGSPPLFGPPRAPAMSDRKPAPSRAVTHIVTQGDSNNTCLSVSTVQSCDSCHGTVQLHNFDQLRSTRLEVQVEVQLNSHVSGKRVPGNPAPSEDFREGCGVAIRMTKARKSGGLTPNHELTWS